MRTWLSLLVAALLAGCQPGAGSIDPGTSGHGTDPHGTTPDPTDPTHTTPPPGAPTWYQDVAPLVADRCGSCHRAGGIAPFSVETYENAEPWGEAMLDAVQSGTMPPFYAVEDQNCDPGLDWKEDLRLSDDEKQLLADWVAADMPKGDPTTAAPAELRPIETLDYDVELPIQEPYTVLPTGDDTYECFRVALPNTERMFLTGVEVVPDNELVVHHVLVWSDPNDSSAGQAGSDGAYDCSGFPDIFPTSLIGTWTPGVQPTTMPIGTGTPVDPGGSLVLNVHYHPTGNTTEVDRTKIRLRWTDQEPDMYSTVFLVDVPMGAQVQPGPNDQGGAEFRIPANVPDHLETVQMWFTSLLFSSDATIYQITPHMHYLGTDMLVTLDHADEPDQCLIHTPGWRFDWQRDYTYDASSGDLPVIYQGDKVRVQCMYDNSMANPFMPQHLAAVDATEPYDTYWGEETQDEMCMAIVGLIVPKSGWSPLDWF